MRRLALAALLFLAGCGVNEMLSKPVDYKSAGKQQLPTLEVPPDLTTPARDSRYVMPETGKQSATLSGYQAERQEQAKNTNAVLPQPDRMRVERAGSERWLVVQGDPPEKLWPLVKDFWQENGFILALDLPEAGVMETDWAENRAKIPQDFIRNFLGKILDSVYSTSERDKFRTRLERTADGKGTEIYISHRGMQEVYENNRTVDKTVWQPRDPDPGLEAEFLRRLMVRLGTQDEKARQIAANPLSVEKRAELAGDSLKLFEPFDRAWRRVGLALDRVGFTVEDRDRQQGLYFVRYADPDAAAGKKDDRGFISRLLNRDSKVKAEQYRVVVKQNPDGSQVNVFNKDGGSDSTGTAKRILTLLLEQLK